MKVSVRTLAALAALGALLLLPSATLAQAQATGLEVLVAAVSSNGKSVDPALRGLEETFKRNGLAYTNFKLESSTRLNLAPGKSETVQLSSGKATITLVKTLPDGTATIKLQAPNNSPTFDISPGGEFMQQVGTLPGGKRFLIIRR